MGSLTRKLVMWGGAAALAGAGFAFMASNTIATSSAGEGVGAIAGYHVSNITYNSRCNGNGAGTICTIADVHFALAPNVHTNQAPKTVNVAFLGPTNVKLAVFSNHYTYGYGATACTIGPYTTATPTVTAPAGYYYPVTCIVPTNVSVKMLPSLKLDVAANQ